MPNEEEILRIDDLGGDRALRILEMNAQQAARELEKDNQLKRDKELAQFKYQIARHAIISACVLVAMAIIGYYAAVQLLLKQGATTEEKQLGTAIWTAIGAAALKFFFESRPDK